MRRGSMAAWLRRGKRFARRRRPDSIAERHEASTLFLPPVGLYIIRLIENKVKLIVRDLDDTFWNGTLAEGGIKPIDRNLGIVKTLTSRGIIRSICSKNDADQARARLTEMASTIISHSRASVSIRRGGRSLT